MSPSPVEFTVPVRTPNPLNMQTGNSRIAGIMRARKRAHQRQVTTMVAWGALTWWREFLEDLAPVDVLLTRLSPATMDTDGLAASQKAVRDSVAKALGVDDGSPQIRFLYAQEKCKRGVYGTRVRVSRRGELTE